MRTDMIQFLDDGEDVLKVGRDMCQSGDQDEAFYVLDLGDVVKKFEEWRRRMPRVRTFYAVKCNNDATVIRALASLGTGFDCASKGEIDQVLEIGVPPSRIIFANPAKPASHIRHAATLGVHLMTFDNVIELRKMLALDPAVRLVLRFRCDADTAVVTMGEKYGCDPLFDGPHLLRQVKELDGNLVGVSFHCGCLNMQPAIFRRAILLARGLFDFAEELGFKMTLLDLGGGFPGHVGSSIAEFASVINASLNDFFPSPEVDVIAEPGTFYVASAFTLYTQIHAKREVIQEADKQVMYYINQGVFSSFTGMLFHIPYSLPTPVTPSQGALQWCSVWGPTCSGTDIVHKKLLLPELEAGDWLEYRDMGHYTQVLASTFNGYPVARVHVVVDNQSWLTLKMTLPMKLKHFASGCNPPVLRAGIVDDALS